MEIDDYSVFKFAVFVKCIKGKTSVCFWFLSLDVFSSTKSVGSYFDMFLSTGFYYATMLCIIPKDASHLKLLFSATSRYVPSLSSREYDKFVKVIKA